MQLCVSKTRTDPARPMARFLTRFARDESGVLIVFGLYVFLIMLMVGGIGIDLMRFERDRAKLQHTLDRAVLAAADLDQSLTPAAVVADYFAKAGLSEYLITPIESDGGLGFRTVTAHARMDIATHFMHLGGVDSLSALASSTAEERIDGVEISLVLDVSGSMHWNNRLPRLRVAAQDFIDDMVQNTEAGKLSISIVPYATQVSVPANFINQFSISQEHSYSNCVNFQANDFLETGISLTQPLERTMHFNVWHYDEGRRDNPPRLVVAPVCEDDPRREMVILQNNAEALKAFIRNVPAAGNTSIDIGMKWGAALLDPSLRPVITRLIADGTVDPAFAGLPLSHTSSDTLKVIVLMTDGENTGQHFMENQFRNGPSNVWWNEAEARYSVYDPIRGAFYWPHNDSWNDHAFGNGEFRVCQRFRWNGTCRRWGPFQAEPGEAVVLNFPDLWAYTSVAENMRENYRPWVGWSRVWNEWYHGVFDAVGDLVKDARTRSICNAAKDQGIIVFTIGFEAPARGEAVLQDCASSINHHFDVAGLEINDAFSAIASSIRKLRLTQ